jgi:hypothetical protein
MGWFLNPGIVMSLVTNKFAEKVKSILGLYMQTFWNTNIGRIQSNYLIYIQYKYEK